METSPNLELLRQLYSNTSPKGFEILIKDLLESIGFDDIEVTGRTGDSGIDLTAILRKSEIPGIDTSVACIVQAKRYQPNQTLNPKIVRELRGSMLSGQRGILITTARVSPKTIETEALKDMSRIVLVIDGERLIELCKNKHIGVLEKYTIDEDYFSRLEASEAELEPTETEIIGSKLVTQNDIRARILRMPSEVKPLIVGKLLVTIHWEDGTKQNLAVSEYENFVSGVTASYRKYGLIDAKGNPHEMFSQWEAVDDGFLVRFKKAEYEERPDIMGVLEKIYKIKFTRVQGTSIFIGDGYRFLCRYSKRYTRDINYWYGITPRDIALMKENQVTKLAFFCSTTMVAFIEREDFLQQLGNLNITEPEPGVIRHYHIHLKEAGGGLTWVLKGGATIDLSEVRHFATA